MNDTVLTDISVTENGYTRPTEYTDYYLEPGSVDDSASPRYSPELLSYTSDEQISKHQSTEDLVSIIKGLIMTMTCHSISSDNSQGCNSCKESQWLVMQEVLLNK